MGNFPFTIRPIKLDEAVVHTEPISIPNDLSGKMTLSSKHASVHLAELAETFQKKDITDVLMTCGDEEVILSTNTILKLSRAGEAEMSAEERKKYWAVPALVGLIIGISAIVFFRKDVSVLFIVVAVSSAFSGGLVGFVWQKFYELRLKKIVQEWAKEILEN